VKIEFTIIVKVDIYLANYQTLGQRTNYIDVRCHFARECIENGSEGYFMRCEDNLADQLTKNVRQEI